MVSQTAADYLAQIYRIQAERGSAATQDVAERRHVTPASTTAMFKRLAREGLVQYKEYEGVSLTERGEHVALTVLRRHRVAERFLTDTLGIPWEDVDDLADRMEHAMPDQVIDALERLVGCPGTCPHGFPIPDKEGHFVPPPQRHLAEAESGECLRVACVDERVPGLLAHLQEIGLQPGTEFTVVQRGAFHDTLVLSVGSERVTVGPRVSRSLYVDDADNRTERGQETCPSKT